MQRRDNRDSNASRSASQRRVTKRTVAYRPAVSIRLSRSLGFPTCLFLASPLSGRMNGTQWRQERRKFSPCFSLLWVSEGPSSLKEKHCQKKKNFWGDDRLWSHDPRALKKNIAPAPPPHWNPGSTTDVWECVCARARACVCVCVCVLNRETKHWTHGLDFQGSNDRYKLPVCDVITKAQWFVLFFVAYRSCAICVQHLITRLEEGLPRLSLVRIRTCICKKA